MTKCITLTVVDQEANPLLSLLMMRRVGAATQRKRAIPAIEVAGYESLPSCDQPGRPNAKVFLRSGEYLFVKEHVSTVAKLVDEAGANAQS